MREVTFTHTFADKQSAKMFKMWVQCFVPDASVSLRRDKLAGVNASIRTKFEADRWKIRDILQNEYQ